MRPPLFQPAKIVWDTFPGEARPAHAFAGKDRWSFCGGWHDKPQASKKVRGLQDIIRCSECEEKEGYALGLTEPPPMKLLVAAPAPPLPERGDPKPKRVEGEHMDHFMARLREWHNLK